MEADMIQLALAGAAGFGVIITMQFKINRCVGRLEGMLETHLKK